MVELLSLPEELLLNIFRHFIANGHYHAAVKVRSTCKSFNRLLITATWTSGALEYERDPIECPIKFLARCLQARTIADWQYHRHLLSRIIYETIQFLKQISMLESKSDHEYIFEACVAVALYHSKNSRRTPAYTTDEVLVMEDIGRLHNAQEHALAFAAYLGLTSAVERLVEDGTRGRYTCFGPPLNHIVARHDPEMLRVYLDARLRLQTRHRPAWDLEPDLKPSSFEWYDRFLAAGRRDITAREYHLALQDAISLEKVETVRMLLDAASDDDEWPLWSQGTRKYRLSILKKPGWSLKADLYSCILFHATDHDQPTLAKFALEQGADANVTSLWPKSFHTALTNAATRGHTGIFNLLLEHGADIHLSNSIQPGLLSMAVTGGSIDIVRTCLDAGIKSIARDKCSHPVAVARVESLPEILELLLDRGLGIEVGWQGVKKN